MPADLLDDAFLNKLTEFGGKVPHMYCDADGQVRVGVGHLLKNSSDAARLQWTRRMTGKAGFATGKEVEDEWKKVKSNFRAGQKASHYKQYTTTDVSDAQIRSLLKSNVLETAKQLRTIFPSFDDYSVHAQRGLVDMALQLGAQELSTKFPRLTASVKDMNWQRAALECSRNGAAAERNQWTANQFQEAFKECISYYLVKLPPSSEDPNGLVSTRQWRRESVSVGTLTIAGRKKWGGGDPTWAKEIVYYNTRSTMLGDILDTIVIHHTNNSSSIKENEANEQARGFAAIGYHFFITKEGTIYEGRPLEVMGSHAGEGKTSGVLNDPDWKSIGIVLQGDYHSGLNIKRGEGPLYNSPTKELLGNLESLVVELTKSFRISRLLMHREITRQGTPTVCPGNVMVPHIESLRKALNLSATR